MALRQASTTSAIKAAPTPAWSRRARVMGWLLLGLTLLVASASLHAQPAAGSNEERNEGPAEAPLGPASGSSPATTPPGVALPKGIPDQLLANPNMPRVEVRQDQQGTTIVYPLLRQKVVRLPNGQEGLAVEFGGNLEGVYVGMQALVDLQWDEQKTNEGNSFWWSEMRFMSSGPQSDLLLRGIALLYEIKPPNAPSVAEQVMKVAAIGTRPGPLSQELPLKVFLQDTSRPDYAEFFVNINLENKTVELAERDPRYRAAMVKNFFEQE